MIWVLTIAVAILYLILIVVGLTIRSYYKEGKRMVEQLKDVISNHFDKF